MVVQPLVRRQPRYEAASWSSARRSRKLQISSFRAGEISRLVSAGLGGWDLKPSTSIAGCMMEEVQPVEGSSGDFGLVF